MFEYLFTFQSLTAAQSARSVLNTEGIRAPVARRGSSRPTAAAMSCVSAPATVSARCMCCGKTGRNMCICTASIRAVCWRRCACDLF